MGESLFQRVRQSASDGLTRRIIADSRKAILLRSHRQGSGVQISKLAVDAFPIWRGGRAANLEVWTPDPLSLTPLAQSADLGLERHDSASSRRQRLFEFPDQDLASFAIVLQHQPTVAV